MKHAKYVLTLLVGLALMVPTFINAQVNFNGGRGLNYVHSAWSLEPGNLTLTTHSRAFGKNKVDPALGSFMIWDVSGRFHLNYGVNDRLEVAASPTVYQDTNTGPSGINAPDVLFLSAKYGSISSPGSSTALGVLVSTRIPLGGVHNLPFEHYATNNIAFGVTGLFSYSKDPLYPEGATNFHVNLGYWNHNDVGAETGATSMSQEVLYGFGVKAPKEKFEFSAEIYGNLFVKAPPSSAFSRENYLYISPGISYAPFNWFALTFGTDLRLLDSKDKSTSQVFPNSPINYASWRIHFGTKFNLRPSRSYRVDEREVLMQKAQSRRELFEQIINEQRDTEAAEAELERIKSERIRAEKELERLRQILEGETSGENGKSAKEEKGKKGKN